MAIHRLGNTTSVARWRIICATKTGHAFIKERGVKKMLPVAARCLHTHYSGDSPWIAGMVPGCHVNPISKTGKNLSELISKKEASRHILAAVK